MLHRNETSIIRWTHEFHLKDGEKNVQLKELFGLEHASLDQLVCKEEL